VAQFLNWVRLVISPFVWSGHQRDAGPLFLNTEGNEGKTGTEIKIRKAGKQERVKTSNSTTQAPVAQTPTAAGDDGNDLLFITRDFNRG
jgi:hypothetical protein